MNFEYIISAFAQSDLHLENTISHTVFHTDFIILSVSCDRSNAKPLPTATLTHYHAPHLPSAGNLDSLSPGGVFYMGPHFPCNFQCYAVQI